MSGAAASFVRARRKHGTSRGPSADSGGSGRNDGSSARRAADGIASNARLAYVTVFYEPVNSLPGPTTTLRVR